MSVNKCTRVVIGLFYANALPTLDTLLGLFGGQYHADYLKASKHACGMQTAWYIKKRHTPFNIPKTTTNNRVHV